MNAGLLAAEHGKGFVLGDDANAGRASLIEFSAGIAAMVGAIERPASGARVLGVPEIRGR